MVLSFWVLEIILEPFARSLNYVLNFRKKKFNLSDRKMTYKFPSRGFETFSFDVQFLTLGMYIEVKVSDIVVSMVIQQVFFLNK
jgi:hypothetical protein